MVKEVVRIILKIFFGIMWFLSFCFGYIFMGTPPIMAAFLLINFGCDVILGCVLKEKDK